MAAHPSPLRVERPAQGVLALWLDRPQRRNAVDPPLLRALHAAFETDARAIVLGTSDARCFCAGADLDLDDEVRAELSDGLYGLYHAMLVHPAPIVAAIDGPAVGGGAQLALAADVRIGSQTASFRFAGPGHGLAVGAWGLPSLVGRGRASDFMLSMRTVDADEAQRAGLLDRIEPDPRAAAVELAEAFARLDPGATSRVKAVVQSATGLLDALEEERRGNREAWSGSVAGLRGREAAR